ncbi:hypothetical protein [Facilibium subflavum]|uniref:hypothetical protein n=1 Tax=Facilibium subflavum TaxID=2219058 RepID=UPI000E659CE7|nr:hypothetical protein [Facilibium subflavum]
MSKKKVTLSNRKRLSDLQEGASKTTADIRRQQIQSMREMHIMPEGKLDLAVEQMVADVVLELTHSYQQWSLPLDKNRYRYSPNERNKKLINALKSYLTEIADWLMSKGIRGNECLDKCQEITDKVVLELRKSGVAIGTLQLRQSKDKEA